MFRPPSGSARLTALAADPDTSWMVLWLLCLVCVPSRPLARVLAGNTRLPRPLLWWLAPLRWDVRAAVAANPRCPQPLLRAVSLSENWAVRAAIAANPAASARVLDLVGRKFGPRERARCATGRMAALGGGGVAAAPGLADATVGENQVLHRFGIRCGRLLLQSTGPAPRPPGRASGDAARVVKIDA